MKTTIEQSKFEFDNFGLWAIELGNSKVYFSAYVTGGVDRVPASEKVDTGLITGRI